MEDKFMFINNSQNNVHSTNGANFVQFPPNQPINNQGSKIVQISPSVSVAPPIPEEEPLFKCINDGYFEYSTGYFFTDKKNARKRFTDFIITKIKRCVKIGLNDCQEEFFTLNLKSENGFEDSVSIPTDKFADLFKEIEKNHHQFLIFTDRYSRANEFFKRVSKEILRRELSAGRVQIEYVYSRWGWGLPFASGERKFFSDSPTEQRCPKVLLSLTDLNQRLSYLQDGFNLFYLQPLETILPLLVYALASYSDALFTDAGYPLEHSLMLVGKSGSGKTSIARAIYSPFEPEGRRIHTVEGTEAAMKLLVRDSRDDVLVVDDFNLEGTRQELNRKLRNMRLLIRIQSDKSAPEKFGVNSKIERSESRGGTVFTGEVSMLGQISSSELRYLKIFFNQPLSSETLSILQANHFYWCYLLSEWIRYLEVNYLYLVSYIRDEFPKDRQINATAEPRLRDAFIHHVITFKIFISFLQFNGLIDESNGNKFSDLFSDIMSNLVKRQEYDSKQRAIHIMFIAELRNLRGNGNVIIAPSLDYYSQHLKEYLGYEDGKGHVLLKKDETFRIISESYRSRGEYFSTSANELPKILYENGLTTANSGSFTVKASSLIEGRPPMICLIQSVYEKMLAELID